MFKPKSKKPKSSTKGGKKPFMKKPAAPAKMQADALEGMKYSC